MCNSVIFEFIIFQHEEKTMHCFKPLSFVITMLRINIIILLFKVKSGNVLLKQVA